MYNYEGVDVFPSTTNLDAFRWADVIMTHLDFTQSSIIDSYSVEKPLIHFVHNDIAYACIQNTIRGAHIVYNSEWIKNKIGYNWPSFVLHPPCNVEDYRIGMNPEENEYITLISLNERKGGYLFKKIAEAMPGRKFIGVVGSYDNPGALKLSQDTIIEMMPPNVTVIPNSPNILDVYKKTRILLMPSDYESWGRTATEAMCSGIPVVCTPTDGLQENCGDAAVYVGSKIKEPLPGEASVKTGTVQEWVKAIKKFDNKDYYKKYSLLCTDRAKSMNPQGELTELEQFLLKARF